MSRWLKVTLIVLAILLLVPVAAVLWVAGTETGTRFAFERVKPMLPEGTTVGRVEGRLGARLTVHDVALDDEAMRLRLDRVELHWTASALLRGQVRVRDLHGTGLRVELLPAEAEPEPIDPAEPLELPRRIRHYVDVELARVRLSDILILPAPDADPVEVDSIELAATLADARLHIERVEIVSDLLMLAGEAEIRLAGNYPIEATLDWAARLPELPEAQGATRIEGELTALVVSQRVAAPYNLELDARVTDAVRTGRSASDVTPHLTATARVQSLSTAAIDPQLLPMTISLDAIVDGPFDALGVELDAWVEDIEQGRVDARMSALVGPEALELHELVITQPAHDGRLHAAGRVEFIDDFVADVKVNWERLQWPLDVAPEVQSERGEIVFVGSADDYRLRVDTVVDLADQPRVTLDLSGRGDMEQVVLDLAAVTEAGNVTGRADVSWAPQLTGRVELHGDALDPGFLLDDFPGRIDFTLVAGGFMEDGTLRAELESLEVAGTLRDAVLAMRARGAFTQTATQTGDAEGLPDQVIDIDLFEFAFGATRVSASGRVAESPDLRWEIDAPDLAELYPGARGRVAGSGTVGGTLPRPRVSADLSGSDFAFADYTLANLSLNADVDLAGTEASSLTLDAEGGDAAGVLLERLQLRGSGRPEDHQLELVLRSSEGAVDAGLTGRLEEPSDADPRWHFRMTEARLEYPELAAWELDDPAVGSVGAEQVSVARHCWISGDARFCVGAEQRPNAFDVAFELSGLAFDYFAALMPAGYEIGGALGGTGTLSQREGEPLVGEIDLVTTAGELVLEAPDPRAPAAVRIGLEPSHARLALTPGLATAEIELIMEHGHVRLNARLPDPTNDTDLLQRPLEGAFSVEIPELAFINEFVPDLTEAGGGLSGEVAFAGTLSNPLLMGSIALVEGRARLPDVGILLTDISLELRGEGGDVLAVAATATSGEGRIDLTGQVSPFEDVPTANLRIEGENFEAVNTRDARVIISPNLVVAAGQDRIDIGGEVLIPFADITPGEIPAGAVRASDDQVLLEDDDEEVEPGAVTQALHARVRVRLGDDVRFEGFGLTARFEGNVLVVERPEVPTTATGELRILDGEYEAYGQGLVIETGRILFAGGPLTEPGLDIQAVRRPREGILVGANVRGTLETPEFTLFSEPPMVQQEQLSWLILGRSLQEAPAGEQSALSQAALALGVRGGDFLARNIGDRLGIDQLTIETGTGEAGAPADPSEAALVAGVFVTPRIFVSYGIGLFEPINVLRIRYTITSNLELVTESSSESTGADVFYTFELGR